MYSGAALYLFTVGVGAGILASFSAHTDAVTALAALGIGVVCAFLSISLNRSVLLFGTILFASLALGMLRACYFIGQFSQQNVLAFAGNNAVQVEGAVAANPDRRPTATHANVSVISINGAPRRAGW